MSVVEKQPEVSTSEVLWHNVEAAAGRLNERQRQSDAQLAEEVGRVSLLASLKDAVRPHARKVMELKWKELKAVGLIVVSLVPIIGEGAAGIKAADEAMKAGVNAQKLALRVRNLQRAGDAARISEAETALVAAHASYVEKLAFAKALFSIRQKGVFARVTGRGRSSVEALKHITGAKGPKKFLWTAVHAFDPTPDVPSSVSLGFFLAEAFGLHGASAIPAFIQLAMNSVETAKVYGRMGKDVVGVVKAHVRRDVAALRDPQVVQAARAFMPAAS